MGRGSAGRASARTISTPCAIEFYRDRDVAFEGFTGKSYLFREEFTSRIWATRYDFPAIRDGRVKRDVIPDETPSGAQGWFFNTRREKFKDKRAARGVHLRLRFRMDQQDHHVRVLPADPFGVPELRHDGGRASRRADELALLEPFRGKVADEVFGEPFVPPVSDGSGQDRALLRKASALLQEAGYRRQGRQAGRRRKGEPISVEFLIDEPSFQPHHMPFIKNLGTLGIEATLRIVDPVQYRKRVDDFDFDLTMQRFAFSSTPGDSLRTYFTSQAAAMKGSQNLAGIADPVDRCADRQDHRRRQPPGAGRRPARRSTGSSAPAATGFRTGTRPRTGSPIGTCSAGPRQSRATRAAFRRPGGTIATRRPRSSGRDRREALTGAAISETNASR